MTPSYMKSILVGSSPSYSKKLAQLIVIELLYKIHTFDGKHHLSQKIIKGLINKMFVTNFTGNHLKWAYPW